MNILLCFFYVFSFAFNRNIFIDSSMVVGLYLTCETILKPKLFREFVSVLRSKYFINISVVYLILNIWSLSTMLMNGSKDFTFMQTFFHMYYYFVEGAWLFSFYRYKKCDHKIVNYVIASYAIQTAIQWFAFLIPSFKALINSTKSIDIIAKGVEYGGARANALSGSDFFGLSAGYALVFILYFSDKNTFFKENRPMKFLLFLFLITGTFFAGRTGYVGLLMSVIYYITKMIISKGRRGIKLSEIIAGSAVIGIVICTISVFITQFSETKIFKSLFRFTFQSFFNEAERGSFSVSSLSHLLNDMYFKIPFSTFLIGDAQYTTSTRHYYMSTDSGYLRPILFFGIIGFIGIVFMQFLIVDLKNGSEKLVAAFIMIAYFVISIKGEMFVWNSLPLTVTVLFAQLNRNCRIKESLND